MCDKQHDMIASGIKLKTQPVFNPFLYNGLTAVVKIKIRFTNTRAYCRVRRFLGYIYIFFFKRFEYSDSYICLSSKERKKKFVTRRTRYNIYVRI